LMSPLVQPMALTVRNRPSLSADKTLLILERSVKDDPDRVECARSFC
jgi:hypothetical protein